MRNLANYFAGCNSFRNRSDDYRRFGIAYSSGSGYYAVGNDNHGEPVRDAAGSVMYRTDAGEAIEWVAEQNS